MGIARPKDLTEILKTVRVIVAEVAECPEQSVASERRMIDQGVDSLGVVEVFVRVHSQFNLSAPSDDSIFALFDTPAKVARYVLETMS